MYDIIYMNINIYMQIHVNIFQIYAVCVRLYIHKYTQHTHILFKQTFILDAIKEY